LTSVKLAGRIAILVTLNTLLLAALQWYVLLKLGVGPQTDALFASFTVPQLLVMIFANTLFVVGVPVVSTISDQSEKHRTGWTLTWLTALGYTGIAVILGVLAPFWLPLVFPGFDGETVNLAVHLLRIHLLAMIGFAINTAMWVSYHAARRFVAVESLSLAGGVVSIGFLVVALPRMGVEAAAWAAVIRFVIQTVVLAFGLRPWVLPNFGLPGVVTTLRRSKPMLVSISLLQLNTLADRFFASLAPAGELSLLHTAQTLHNSASGVLGKSVVSPGIPILASAVHERDTARFDGAIRRRVLVLLAVILSGAALGLIAGEPLLGFVFRSLKPSEVHSLWLLTLLLVGVALGGPLAQLFGGGFLALGDTKTPSIISVVANLLGVGAKVLGYKIWGIYGLALATSLTNLGNLVVLREALRRRTRPNSKH